MLRNRYAAIAVSAAWWGLVAGLLEGFAYRRFPLLRNPDLPWIVVLLAGVEFLCLGCIFLLAARFVRQRPLLAAANLVFALVAFYDCATVGVGDHAERVLLRIIALALAGCVAGITWKFAEGWPDLQRKTVLCLALFALLYTGWGPVRRAWRERRQLAQFSRANHAPNVLVIIVDALRADHLSTYGYGRTTSPYMTELAGRGVLFQNAITTAPWTLPAHASILTGHLPHETGADRPDGYLDPSLPTLAEVFRARGYRTAAFSANWWFFSRRLGFGRGFLHFEDFTSMVSAAAQTNLGQRTQNLLLKLKILRTPLGRASAEQVSGRMLRWLDQGSGPFFVVANYMDVHEPYLPPLSCFHRFSKRARPAGTIFVGNPRMDHLTRAEVQDEMDAYDASIACFDEQLKALMADLQQRQLMRNTVIVLTADHGEGFGEHGLMSHGNSLYQELIHVPLIITGPGIPEGKVVSRPASLLWLAPTLLALSGGNPGPFSGPTMNGAWSSAVEPAWPDPVSEVAQLFQDPNAPNYTGAMVSLITPRWHLIVGGKNGEELYACCAADDGRNLAAATPAVAQMLKAELQRTETQEAGRRPPGGGPADRERMNDYLKALGYVPNQE